VKLTLTPPNLTACTVTCVPICIPHQRLLPPTFEFVRSYFAHTMARVRGSHRQAPPDRDAHINNMGSRKTNIELDRTDISSPYETASTVIPRKRPANSPPSSKPKDPKRTKISDHPRLDSPVRHQEQQRIHRNGSGLPPVERSPRDSEADLNSGEARERRYLNLAERYDRDQRRLEVEANDTIILHERRLNVHPHHYGYYDNYCIQAKIELTADIRRGPPPKVRTPSPKPEIACYEPIMRVRTPESRSPSPLEFEGQHLYGKCIKCGLLSRFHRHYQIRSLCPYSASSIMNAAC
jgi:hypothetical protein